MMRESENRKIYKHTYITKIHMKDNTEDNIEELKKRLFRDEDAEKANLTEIVDEYTKKLGNVDLKGHPIIKPEILNSLTRKDLLKAQITGRTVASLIEKNITEDIGIKEIIKWNIHEIPENQVIARVNDLVKEGFLIRKKRGVFKGRIYQIKMWLKNLKVKNG